MKLPIRQFLYDEPELYNIYASSDIRTFTATTAGLYMYVNLSIYLHNVYAL